MISKSLRNLKRNHLSSISTIEVNDKCSNKERNDFLSEEDPDNQCPENKVITQVEKYDFMSKLPPCLK
jgi:hypothetical protein